MNGDRDDNNTRDGFEDWSSSNSPDTEENDTHILAPKIIGSSLDDADTIEELLARSPLCIDVDIEAGQVGILMIETTSYHDGSQYVAGQQVAVTDGVIVPCDDGGYVTSTYRKFLGVLAKSGIDKEAIAALLETHCNRLIDWVESNATLKSRTTEDGETQVDYVLVWPEMDDEGNITVESVNWDEEMVDVIRDWHAPGVGFI